MQYLRSLAGQAVLNLAVRRIVVCGHISLHGWHDVIEDGAVCGFDVKCGAFIPTSSAAHSGTGRHHHFDGDPGVPPMTAGTPS